MRTETPGADAEAVAPPAEEATAPARPRGQILADIEKERDGLEQSFTALRRDLDEALDAGRRRAAAARGKVAVAVPVAGAVVVSVVVAAMLFRRRSGTTG